MERAALQALQSIVASLQQSSVIGYSSRNLDKLYEAISIDLAEGPKQPLWDQIRSIICDPFAALQLSGETLKRLRKFLIAPDQVGKFQFGPLKCAQCEKEIEERTISSLIGQRIYCFECAAPYHKCSKGHLTIVECSQCQSQPATSSKPADQLSKSKRALKQQARVAARATLPPPPTYPYRPLQTRPITLDSLNWPTLNPPDDE